MSATRQKQHVAASRQCPNWRIPAPTSERYVLATSSATILTIRTFMRRFTRLSLGFSKKPEKSLCGCRPALRALQLLPPSRNAAH